MRCSEARRRMNGPMRESSRLSEDSELREHLEICPACAEQAKAVAELRFAFLDLSAESDVTGDSFASIRSRIETDLASRRAKPAKDIGIMRKFVDYSRKRSRLSLGLAAAVVLLLAVTLIPFKFQTTVGYEVAVAGVDKNLAMDQNRIHQLLDRLGVEGADINVDDCELTCHLTIRKLKSEEQVELVLAAFDKVNNVVLDTVVQLSGEDTQTLWARVDNLFFEEESHTLRFNRRDGDQVTVELVEKLHADSSQYFNIWTPKDPVSNIVYESEANEEHPAHAMFIGKPEDGEEELELGLHSESGGVMTVTLNNGEVHRVDLNDPDAVERLKALGLNVTHLDGEDVALDFIEEKPTAKAADEGALPDQFHLSQNYPNPFNPTTTIAFNLVRGGRVSLRIFDIQGRLVSTLIDDVLTAGRHSIEWNATDGAGRPVASGVYLYKLTAGDNTETKKMTLIK